VQHSPCLAREIEKDQDDVIDFLRFRLRKAAKCSDGLDDPIEFSRFFNSESSQTNATAFLAVPIALAACQ